VRQSFEFVLIAQNVYKIKIIFHEIHCLLSEPGKESGLLLHNKQIMEALNFII
jgi:hypothetical protein